MNRIPRTLLAVTAALTSVAALAIQQPSQAQPVQSTLTRAQVRRDLMDFSSRSSLPSEQPSPSRAELRAELMRPLEQGRPTYSRSTRTLGYGSGSPQASGPTRAEVRAEAARALRNGQIAYGEISP